MTTETKRDLHEDLAFCEETEPAEFVVGSTSSAGTAVLSRRERRLLAKMSTVDLAEFIVESRTGWPEAIRRAIAAEAEVGRLERRAQDAEAGEAFNRQAYECERVTSAEWRSELKEANLLNAELNAECVGLAEENRRLREIVSTECPIGALDIVASLRAELAYVSEECERMRAALERMDDRKNPMLPRSVMARIAKEALDYE